MVFIVFYKGTFRYQKLSGWGEGKNLKGLGGGEEYGQNIFKFENSFK